MPSRSDGTRGWARPRGRVRLTCGLSCYFRSPGVSGSSSRTSQAPSLGSSSQRRPPGGSGNWLIVSRAATEGRVNSPSAIARALRSSLVIMATSTPSLPGSVSTNYEHLNCYSTILLSVCPSADELCMTVLLDIRSVER